MARSERARDWLQRNGYVDVADMIDEVMAEWRAAGKKTRRNWWEVLAGLSDGTPCTYAGRTFPVLRVAQIRAGLPVTPNALARSENESIPEIWRTPRWPRRRKRNATGVRAKRTGIP